MSFRQEIIQAIVAKPGMTSREVAIALGQPHTRITTISANLGQLVTIGKMRSEPLPKGRGLRYWPTGNATKDLRKLPRKAKAQRRPKPTAKLPQPPRETRAAMRARMATERDRTMAKPADVPRLITPRRTAVAITGAQTVDDFMRAGGVIQKLHPHASSNPLRFDHSDNSQHRRGRIQRRREGAL